MLVQGVMAGAALALLVAGMQPLPGSLCEGQPAVASSRYSIC